MARLIEGSDELTPIRWYWAAPGAQVFPGTTAFGSPAWEVFPNLFPGPGVFRDPQQWRPNAFPAPPGDHFEGKAQWYLTGIPPDQLAIPPIGEVCGVPVISPQGGVVIGGDGWTVRIVSAPCQCCSPADDVVTIEPVVSDPCVCVQPADDVTTGEIPVSNPCVCVAPADTVLYGPEIESEACVCVFPSSTTTAGPLLESIACLCASPDDDVTVGPIPISDPCICARPAEVVRCGPLIESLACICAKPADLTHIGLCQPWYDGSLGCVPVVDDPVYGNVEITHYDGVVKQWLVTLPDGDEWFWAWDQTQPSGDVCGVLNFDDAVTFNVISSTLISYDPTTRTGRWLMDSVPPTRVGGMTVSLTQWICAPAITSDPCACAKPTDAVSIEPEELSKPCICASPSDAVKLTYEVASKPCACAKPADVTKAGPKITSAACACAKAPDQCYPYPSCQAWFTKTGSHAVTITDPNHGSVPFLLYSAGTQWIYQASNGDTYRWINNGGTCGAGTMANLTYTPNGGTNAAMTLVYYNAATGEGRWLGTNVNNGNMHGKIAVVVAT